MTAPNNAREARDRQREKAAKATAKKVFDEDIRAARRMIKYYTHWRRWDMVEDLFYELGLLLERKAAL